MNREDMFARAIQAAALADDATNEHTIERSDSFSLSSIAQSLAVIAAALVPPAAPDMTDEPELCTGCGHLDHPGSGCGAVSHVNRDPVCHCDRTDETADGAV